MAQRSRHSESGFALLLVFLMAAVIAITLYMELPRVAFEAQRQKEQMLMDRGEQYKRAIQLYYKATGKTRYPADIDDLDRGLNNMRFLRHRYRDPMTGKDEWRVIHMMNGVVTDSVLNKKAGGDQANSQGGSSGSITAMTGITDSQNTGQNGPVNLAMRRRPSDGGTATMGGSTGTDGQPPGVPPAVPRLR